MNSVTGNLLSGTGTGTGTLFHKTVVFLINSFNSYPSFVVNFVTGNLLSRTGTGTGTFFHKTFVFLTDSFTSFSYFLINSVTVNLLSDYSKDLALNMINSLSRTGTETGIILYKNIVFLTYLSIVLTLLQMNFVPDTGNFLHVTGNITCKHIAFKIPLVINPLVPDVD